MDTYHNVEPKKPDLKEYIPYSFIYIKHKGRVDQDSDYPWWGRGQ